jgi:hypothetical protein
MAGADGNFSTADGRNGRMRMYIWNGAEPWRDGDLEAGIVIHGKFNDQIAYICIQQN